MIVFCFFFFVFFFCFLFFGFFFFFFLVCFFFLFCFVLFCFLFFFFFCFVLFFCFVFFFLFFFFFAFCFLFFFFFFLFTWRISKLAIHAVPVPHRGVLLDVKARAIRQQQRVAYPRRLPTAGRRQRQLRLTRKRPLVLTSIAKPVSRTAARVDAHRRRTRARVGGSIRGAVFEARRRIGFPAPAKRVVAVLHRAVGAAHAHVAPAPVAKVVGGLRRARRRSAARPPRSRRGPVRGTSRTRPGPHWQTYSPRFVRGTRARAQCTGRATCRSARASESACRCTPSRRGGSCAPTRTCLPSLRSIQRRPATNANHHTPTQ